MKTLLFILMGFFISCDSDEPEGETASAALVCEGYEIQGELVTDLSTGLIWDRFVQQSFMTHDEAAGFCEQKGARLPARADLALRNRQEGDACQLPACPFYGARCLTIQCGSQIPGSDAHWGVAMSGGALVAVPSGQAEALLCVRNAKKSPSF